MNLSDATWEEIDALDRATAVVIPFAAIEQHGPHLPIGTDSLITEGIVRRAEELATSPFLWLPVQRFGSSPHHLPFAGSVSLSSRTFLDAAGELADSFIGHGFERIVLFNGHGGNQALLDVAVQETRLRHPSTRIVHATYWKVAHDEFARIRETALGGMGHAGEMETSVMLALHPDLVRTEKRAPDGTWGRSRCDSRDMLDGGHVGQFRFWPEMSAKGVLGDPTSASAEKGWRFLDAAAKGLVEVLDALAADQLG